MKIKRYLQRYFISPLLRRIDRISLCKIHDRPSYRLRTWQGVVGVALLLLWLWAVPPAYPQVSPDIPAIPSAPSAQPVPASAPAAPIRVATRLIRPDAFEENGQLIGFSVDIGQRVLEQMQRQSQLKTYSSVAEILEAIRSGQADLGIAAIALTSQREREFDFSHPILSAGLQIMVPAPDEQTRRAEQEIWRRLLQPDLLRLSGIVVLLMLIPAHVLWYFERNNKDGVIENSSYIPGIFQSLWWTLLALVGQADEMPRGPVGKLVGLFWMIVGIIYLTYFTAGLTAELTTQELQGNIQGLSDLQDRLVALVADGEAMDYLKAHNVRQVSEFSQPEQAYRALLDQQVEAIIAPRPLLLYYTSHDNQFQFQVVGTPFRDQFYSIVMPQDSPYRQPVNQAILVLRENGTYGEIYRKWFGVDP